MRSLGVALSTKLAQSIVRTNAIATGNSATGRGTRATASTASRPPDDSDESTTSDTGGEEAADYCRYSSDNQSDTSIDDQYRACNGKANTMVMSIPSHLHYWDAAVSGTKLKRDGLQRMLADAKAGKFKTIFFYSLSRLGRESAITVPMLKELVYIYHVRFVSVSDGVDSRMANWELIAAVLNVYNEQFIRQLSADVFRGAVGTLLAKFSVGDYRFGYTSVPSPGGEVSGRGRNLKPKMVYAIDDVQADWVRRIFDWYVVDHQGAEWIARQLTSLGAPKDHRSRTKDWHDYDVRSVLSCPKYVGVWPWGERKTIRNPLDGRIRRERRTPAETEAWLRILPKLQIVEEEIFEEAQKKLQANAAKCASRRDDKGKLRGSRSDGSLRHMLEGLIVCDRCGSAYHTCGSQAAYMGCSKFKRGQCSNSITLVRSLTERKLLEVIGNQVLRNEIWRQQIRALTIGEVERRFKAEPDEASRLRSQIAAINKARSKLLDLCEGGASDPDILQRLHQRRTEKESLERQLKAIEKRQPNAFSLPSAEWVDEQLARLADLLVDGTPASWLAVRGLLAGPIVAEPIVKPGGKRGYVRGRFQLRTGSVILAPGSSTPSILPDGTASTVTTDIVIDFTEPDKIEEQAKMAWELYIQGKLSVEIAREMGLSKPRICAILKHAKALYVDTPIDGRRRRHTLLKKSLVPTIGQLKSDEVMELYHANNLLVRDIALQVGLDRNTVTSIVAAYYRERGLPVPDARKRRTLVERNRSDPIQASS